MSFQIGEQVGAYQIEGKLGQGGMATVYRAYHPALERYVAIKVLHSVFAADEAFIRRFRREARLVAQLDHPNIVPIYDFAEQNGHPYLVMRWVEGETLRERLSRGMLHKVEIAQVAAAVANALDYAHAQGVLHRDVKPSNIMIGKDGRIAITDFGLARLAEAGESTLSQNMMLGTPQYISPEQARGNGELDKRADIYSLGVVLFELVCGRVPFQSETSYTLVHDHIFTPPPKAGELNGRVPASMEVILKKALAKNPTERYESSGELVTAFCEALAKVSGEIAPLEKLANVPAFSVATNSSALLITNDRQRTLLLIGLGIMIGMCLCAILIFILSRLESPTQGLLPFIYGL